MKATAPHRDRRARPQKPARRILERYALHEAGHAVACVLLARRVRFVELKATDDGLVGCVACGQHPRLDPRGRAHNARARWMVEREVMITWAGMAAEELFRTKRDLRGLDDDADAIVNLLARLERDKPRRDDLGRFLLLAIRMILSENRASVKRVADALVASGRLGAAEVRRLVKGCVTPTTTESRGPRARRRPVRPRSPRAARGRPRGRRSNATR